MLTGRSHLSGALPDLPGAVQLLTSGVPGFAEPQFVLTGAGAPHPVLPFDLRGLGGPVTALSLAPGVAVEDMVREAPSLDLSELMQDLLLRHDLFLQDARGGMHTAIPSEVEHLQWLRLRSRSHPDHGMVCQLPPWGGFPSTTSTTSTTTTAMQGGVTTVRLTMTGGGMTVTTAPVPVPQFDIVEELATLLIAMSRSRRLPADAHLVMAATWPLPQENRHFNIPILIYPPGERRHVIFDPSFDGSQIHSMEVQEGTLPEQILSRNQQNLGFAAWVNGAPQSAVRRPLRTGDFVQLYPGDERVRYPVGHPAQLLGHVNRLHCLSAPFRVPSFNAVALRTDAAGASTEARRGLVTSLDRLLRNRVELWGMRDRARQKVVLLEPGRAPHNLWLDLLSCPTVAEAEPLIRALGIIPEDSRILDSRIESLAAQVFVVAPREVRSMTYTVPNPIFFGAHTLIHLPFDVHPPWHLLPVQEHLMLVTPIEGWVDGAGLVVARPSARIFVPEDPAPEPVAPSAAAVLSTAEVPATTGDDSLRTLTDSGQASASSSLRMSTDTMPSSGTSLAQLPNYRAAQHRRCKQAAALGLVSAHCPCIRGQVICSAGAHAQRQQPRVPNESPPALVAAPVFGGRQVQAGVAEGVSAKVDAEVVRFSAELGYRQCPVSSVPTPFGRRNVSTASADKGSVLYSGHHTIKEPLRLDEHIAAPDDLEVFRAAHQALRLPWLGFLGTDLCAVPDVPACSRQALRICGSPRGQPVHVHLFTDGSQLQAAPGKPCGWSLVVVWEFANGGCSSFTFGGFAGGSLDPFLDRPVGAQADSYHAEIAAATVGCAWLLALPSTIGSTVWTDCSAVVGILRGTMDAKAGLGCSSLAERLRCWAQALDRQRPGCWRVEWLPSHCGNPFNELADCLAKAGARGLLMGAALPRALWTLLQHQLLPWLWLDMTPDPALPTLDFLLKGVYEPGEMPPADCLVGPVATTPPDVRVQLDLRCLSCNVQTLKDKRPLVRQQISNLRVLFAGLQETRAPSDKQVQGQTFLEFASAAHQGEGGCTVLIDRSIPYGVHKGKKCYLEMSHLTCLGSAPRWIAVKVHAPYLRVLVVVAHAPQSGRPVAEVRQWWQDFENQPWIKAHRGRIILLADSNAQLGSVVTASIGEHALSEETPSGTCFRGWLDAAEVALPATFFDKNGTCNPAAREPTWFSPSGAGYRIDFVGIPLPWLPHCHEPQVKYDFELCNRDHVPVTIDVRLQVVGPPVSGGGTPCIAKDPGTGPPEALQWLRAQLCALRPDAWATNVHAHTDKLFQQVRQLGVAACPARGRKCRPFLADASRAWLDCTKRCKSWLAGLTKLEHRLTAAAQQGLYARSAEGWDLQQVHEHLESARQLYKSCQAPLRACVRADKGRFLREAHARLLCSADPFSAKDFFRALRALRPPSKRVIKPYGPLRVSADPTETPISRLSAQQEHFAQLEAAVKCRPSEVLRPAPALPNGARFQHPRLDLGPRRPARCPSPLSALP